MNFHRFISIIAVEVLFLSATPSWSDSTEGQAPSHSPSEVTTLDSLYHFKAGDRIIFKTAWDPGMDREDPFYVSPVPEGTIGTVLDVAKKYVRVSLDDKETWPKPVLLWVDGLYDDDVQGGLSCIGKLVMH